MKTYLSESFLKNFTRKKHSFKALAEHYEFADFTELVELEKDTKWWKIVRHHVDFVFDRIAKHHSHRFEPRILKEYAQIMYKTLFYLEWSPSTELISGILDENLPYAFPYCPLVELNFDRLGDGRVTNDAYKLLYVSILYLRVIAEYGLTLEPAHDCSQIGDKEAIVMYNYVTNMDKEETIKVKYLGEDHETNAQILYNKYLRWITKINLEISAKLQVPHSNIFPHFIAHKDSFNLIFLRKF
jgi:hypothetical protein